MTVCEYFLQGRCRYMQNCRYSHVYDDRSNRNAANTQQLSEVIEQIEDLVVLAEKGGQWPLSCFSPVREGPNIPGWEDVSFEEVRWKMYEARAKGTLDQCINEIKQLYSNAEKQRNILKQPTMERVNLILNVLKGKKEVPNQTSNPFATSSSNIFGGSNQSATNQRSIFGSATQPTGSHGSIFGGSAPTTLQGNVFGGAVQTTVAQGSIFSGSVQPTTPQGNIFGGGFTGQNVFGGTTSTNTFSQNVFGNPQATSQNVFSQAGSGNIFSSATPNQNIFSTPQTPNSGGSAFSTPIFASQNVQSTPVFGSQGGFFQSGDAKAGNVFGGNQSGNVLAQAQNSFAKSEQSFGQKTSGSVFGGQSQSVVGGNQQRPNAMDSSVYSKIEDLSEEETKAFTAKTFVFGKIPLKPPPQEYCN